MSSQSVDVMDRIKSRTRTHGSRKGCVIQSLRGPRRKSTLSWAGHVISRSVSGSPGRCILARRLLPPWRAAGCVTTSHSKSWSVNRSPI